MLPLLKVEGREAVAAELLPALPNEPEPDFEPELELRDRLLLELLLVPGRLLLLLPELKERLDPELNVWLDRELELRAADEEEE